MSLFRIVFLHKNCLSLLPNITLIIQQIVEERFSSILRSPAAGILK